MPKFISGGLKIDVKYNDRTSKYQAKICPTTTGSGERCERVIVGEPASGARSRHGRRIAVDDGRAYKSAAHAAISFARPGLQDLAASNRRGSGWLIAPPKRKRKRRK